MLLKQSSRNLVYASRIMVVSFCFHPNGNAPWWRHQMEFFPRYWPFARGIHRSPVNSPHKGHWRGALMFSLICAWINDWANNGEAGDLRRYRTHYDVTVMQNVTELYTWNQNCKVIYLQRLGVANSAIFNFPRRNIFYLIELPACHLNHINSWQVSSQLRYNDICQVWI